MADTSTTAGTAGTAGGTTGGGATTIAAAQEAPFLDVLLSNPLHSWMVAGATLLILVLVFYVLKVIVLSRIARLAERTKSRWDDVVIDVLKRLRLALIFPALVYASTQALALPGVLSKTIKVLMLLGVGVQLVVAAQRVIDAGLEALVRRTRSSDVEHDATIVSSLSVVRVLIIAVLVLLIVLFALDNLGVEVTPMLTGLGIGGIAVALAVQNILGDLFGSVTILLDKPFVVGDSIQVGDKTGTVERIGIKTTRVRATSGEELVFANTDLLASRVQNFKRMQERRVQFTLGVAFETTSEKVRAIPRIVREAIEKQNKVRFDRCHLKGFGAYSLDYEAVYFVLTPDYKVYTEVQQAINFELFDRFGESGIAFAYPVQVGITRGGPGVGVERGSQASAAVERAPHDI